MRKARQKPELFHRTFQTPKLIGDRLELHPMLVFIALIIGGELFGLLGLVLATDLTMVLRALMSHRSDGPRDGIAASL